MGNFMQLQFALQDEIHRVETRVTEMNSKRHERFENDVYGLFYDFSAPLWADAYDKRFKKPERQIKTSDRGPTAQSRTVPDKDDCSPLTLSRERRPPSSVQKQLDEVC